MTDFNDFIRVCSALEKEKVDYVLIGGVAVILYGMQRLTRDIDVFVKMDPENIERLRKALHSVFDDESIQEITFESLQEFPVIRYWSPDGLCVDIMSRLGEVATYHDLNYEIVDFEGVRIKIASAETLYNLKKDTVRPEDKADAIFLKQLIEKEK
jgi:predicted nucleotidyltransferase